MTIKEIKEEARRKLALNMHQAIVIYTVEFVIFFTLIALVVMSCFSLGINTPAAIVMMCYGILLGIIAVVGGGMINFALVDFYLATYRCKPYNVRRLGDTLARSNITKILLISLKRTLLALLLLLCLIVPGVIYLIRTSMANYLLIANPKMKASTALSASNKVMSGKTGAYFALCMSLVGWYLLGALTLGFGFIFILPYTNLIKAVYYKRALQGDKTVYNTIVQPVSAPTITQNNMQTANIVQPVQQQNDAVSPQAQNVDMMNGVAPIDTLAEDDLIDMNAAMQDFGAPSKAQYEPDIPEIPIMPVNPKKTADSTTARQSIPVVPLDEPVIEESSAQVHEIDGTNIVETERVLTTQELTQSDAVRRQAIENMYSRTDSRSNNVNYFANIGNQSPDDFGVVDDDFGAPIATENVEQTEPVVTAESTENVEPIMSDKDLDEFLRNFDSEPVQEPEFKPLTRSEKAHDRPARVTRERPVHEVKRQADTAHGNEDREDRIARIKREREERLKQNNNS